VDCSGAFLLIAAKHTKEDAKMIVSSLRIFVFLAANVCICHKKIASQVPGGKMPASRL